MLKNTKIFVIFLVVGGLFCVCSSPVFSESAATVSNIRIERVEKKPDVTRISLMLDKKAPYSISREGKQLVVTVFQANLPSPLERSGQNSMVTSIEANQVGNTVKAIVKLTTQNIAYVPSMSSDPLQIFIDIWPESDSFVVPSLPTEQTDETIPSTSTPQPSSGEPIIVPSLPEKADEPLPPQSTPQPSPTEPVIPPRQEQINTAAPQPSAPQPLPSETREKSERWEAPQAFTLALWIEKNVYQPGEMIVFSVHSNQDCYLTLYDIPPADDVTQVFPNGYAEDNLLGAGRDYQIPAASDTFNFEISGYAGSERIVAVCTIDKVDLFGAAALLSTEIFPRLYQSSAQFDHALQQELQTLSPESWAKTEAIFQVQ